MNQLYYVGLRHKKPEAIYATSPDQAMDKIYGVKPVSGTYQVRRLADNRVFDIVVDAPVDKVYTREWQA
jgi:hypothetical protein